MIDIYAAILAGGRSERLGQDKGLLKFDGMYLLDRIYSRLISLTSSIWVIGEPRGEVQIDPALFTPDLIRGIGPLGGLYTALSLSSHPVLIVSCDMPFLESVHLNYLLQNFDSSCDAAIAISSMGIEPLPGIYRPETLPILKGFIDRHDYALYKYLKSIATKYVDYKNYACNSTIFFNINTLSDYKKALYMKKSMERNNSKA